MKKAKLLLVVAFLLLPVISVWAIGIKITCTITEHGICCCKISIELGEAQRPDGKTRVTDMDATIEGNTLVGHLKEPLTGKDPVFVFEKATELDAATAKKLGYKKVVIEPGTYRPVDRVIKIKVTHS
jgi:hypothetical protein